MPSVPCPVPGCGYTTGDHEPVVVAAILNAHATVHRGHGTPGTVLNFSGSSATSTTATAGPSTPV